MSRLRIFAALLCVAAPAYAQYDRPTECWNPGANHFEQVRPGEYQNDLDYGRCRVMNEYRGGNRYYYRDNGRYNRPENPAECWNPHSRHFEEVRSGEVQNDLDFSQCRPLGYAAPPVYYSRGDELSRECWNPRARHYENVREGTRQDDLDYSRCRWH